MNKKEYKLTELQAVIALQQVREFSLPSLMTMAENIKKHKIEIHLSDFDGMDEIGYEGNAYFVVIEKLGINTSAEQFYFTNEYEAYFYAMEKVNAATKAPY